MVPTVSQVLSAGSSGPAAEAVQAHLSATAVGSDVITNAAAVSTTATHAAFAGNNVSNTFPGPITQPDVPRNLSVTFGATWDGGDVIVKGIAHGKSTSETFASGPGTTVAGNVAFTSVSSIVKTAVGAAAGTASVGRGTKLGLSSVPRVAGGLFQADGVEEVGTFDATYGTVVPTTAPNGAHDYFAMYPSR